MVSLTLCTLSSEVRYRPCCIVNGKFSYVFLAMTLKRSSRDWRARTNIRSSFSLKSLMRSASVAASIRASTASLGKFSVWNARFPRPTVCCGPLTFPRTLVRHPIVETVLSGMIRWRRPLQICQYLPSTRTSQRG